MGKANRERVKQANQVPLTGSWIHAVRVLLFSAAIITVYLALSTEVKNGEAPGCGPDSECDKVLTSPWAYSLGIPVSLLGLGLYGAFFFTTFSLRIGDQQKARRTLNSLMLISLTVLGAAIWFVGVQAIAIRAFCPYCCTAHALASLAALIFLSQAGRIGSRLSVRLNYGGGIGVALALVTVIAAGRFILPKVQAEPKIVQLGRPPTNAPPDETKLLSKPAQTPLVESKLDSHSSSSLVTTTQRKPFPVPKANFSLDTNRLPLLGPADSPHRIACLFDYTCHHCRQLHNYIRDAINAFSGQLSCIMIPMPLDANCNALIKNTHRDHVNACNYAKICLAVHQLSPEKYDAFDSWLFSDHKTIKPLATVREHANKLVGSGLLENALTDEAVQKQLNQNIRVYELNSKNGRNSSMPQTIILDRVMFGPPPSAAALKSILKQTLGLK
jgi:uncharacterized membrane protein